VCTKLLDIDHFVKIIPNGLLNEDRSNGRSVQSYAVFSLVKADCCMFLSNYSHVIALAVDDREFSLSLYKVIILDLSEREKEQITKRTVAIIIIDESHCDKAITRQREDTFFIPSSLHLKRIG
jgi:hypothetical protein